MHDLTHRAGAAAQTPGRDSAGLRGAVAFLRCPHCAADLELADASLRCGAGHVFDVARQGYVNLSPAVAKPAAGDTPSMVAARAAFLGAGHYARIAEAVAAASERAVAAATDGCVVDVGAGTGYFLACMLEHQGARVGVALDSSKHALRRAARAHQRVGAAVCDAWSPLPVRSGVAALVLSVLAPRNGPEFQRMLARGGALVLVTPTRSHLTELVDALGLLTVDPHKAERLASKLGATFELVGQRRCEYQLALDRRDAQALAAMGPSAHHGDAASLARRVEALPEPLAVTASVTVAVYRAADTRGHADTGHARARRHGR